MNKGATAEVTISFRIAKPVRQRLMEQARSCGMLFSAYLRKNTEALVYPRTNGKSKRERGA